MSAPGDGAVAGCEPVLVDPPALEGRVVMRQRWSDLAYFHWRYPVDVVQARLPPGVSVDTFDGDAWVGLVPFVMRDVRLGPAPALPYFGTFVEINVRTYVVDERGRRAVWFWSLDVPRVAVVAVARTAFSLPYCWSVGARHRVAGDRHHYTMRRTWPRAGAAPGRGRVDLSYRVGDRIPDADVTDLEHFLTARWALLTRRRGAIRRGRVHHERWPLHRVEDARVTQSVVEAAGLPAPDGAPLAHCTPGVGVAVSWLEP